MSPTISHRCSDIMALPLHIAAGCDMVYTDPPWGQGLVKMFETIMRKAGYQPPANRIEDVIGRLFQLAPRGRPIFVEYGIKTNPDLVIKIARTFRHEFVRGLIGTQLDGNPFITLQFNSNMPDPGPYKGYDLMRHALAYHKATRVFEPFAGTGRTSTEILKCGVSVVASELNPARYAKLQKAVAPWTRS